MHGLPILSVAGALPWAFYFTVHEWGQHSGLSPCRGSYNKSTVGEPAYHLPRNIMPSQHRNQRLQSPCVSEMSLHISVLLSSCGAKRSVRKDMNFRPGLCRATWNLEFGAGLGSPSTLNCCCLLIVNWGWNSAYPALFREDVAVEVRLMVFLPTPCWCSHNCLISGSPLCSYCTFYFYFFLTSELFISYFLYPSFPGKRFWLPQP